MGAATRVSAFIFLRSIFSFSERSMERNSPISAPETSVEARPARAHASGTADAVDEVFRNLRQVIVNNMRNIVDVNATRGHIGSHQHLELAVFESVQARRCAATGCDRHESSRQ